MKAGWKLKTLGELCEIKHGYAFDGKEFGINQSEKHPIILTPGNFQENSTLYFSERNTKRFFGNYSAEYKFDIGDLVVVMTDLSSQMKILGKPAIIEQDNILHNQRIGRFSINENFLLRVYLFYFLQTDSYLKKIKDTATGTMVRHTAPKRILDSKIPVPPLSEQRRIVAILDEAFADIAAAKEKAEQNLKNAKEVFSSYLRYIFNQKYKGWITTKIGKQLTLQRGFDITKKQQNINGKVPVISSSGIKSFHDKAIVNAPGVVIGRKGTLGSYFYIEEDFWPHDTTLWIKNFSGNNEKFVFYFFNFLDVKHLDSGTANPALNRNLIHEIDVSWNNDIKYQKKIVEYLDSLKEETSLLESLYQQKLSNLEELKKSLLQQAFSGAL